MGIAEGLSSDVTWWTIFGLELVDKEHYCTVLSSYSKSNCVVRRRQNCTVNRVIIFTRDMYGHCAVQQKFSA